MLTMKPSERSAFPAANQHQHLNMRAASVQERWRRGLIEKFLKKSNLNLKERML